MTYKEQHPKLPTIFRNSQKKTTHIFRTFIPSNVKNQFTVNRGQERL